MNPELVYRMEMARVLEGRIRDALTAQECAGTDLAFHRALKFWRQQLIHGLQLSVETLAPIRDETLPNGGGEIAEFIRALEYCEIPAPKGNGTTDFTDNTDFKSESGSHETRNKKIESGTQESRKKNLPVPVLAEPQTTQSKASDTGSGEARDSTPGSPVRPISKVTDSRGGQTNLRKHLCRNGCAATAGLSKSAESADEESIPVPLVPSDEKSREVMSQWR